MYAAGRRLEGLTVAAAAAEFFPTNADSFAVLASLAEAEGHREQALRAGLRVLELDPNNRFARSLVERVRVTTPSEP